MKVKTIREHVYGSVHRKPGDVYEADDKWITVFLLQGKVEKIEEPVKPKQTEIKYRYQRRDMRAK